MNYWLIEHYDYPSGHRWLRIWVTGSVNGIDKAELTWTTEPSLALRFARQQDAEMFALMHHEWCVLARITSHMDLDTSGVNEAKALEIYDGWKHLTGWVPWVEGGNSTMQDTARRQASAHGVTRPEHQTDSQHTPMEDKHGSGDPKG